MEGERVGNHVYDAEKTKSRAFYICRQEASRFSLNVSGIFELQIESDSKSRKLF